MLPGILLLVLGAGAATRVADSTPPSTNPTLRCIDAVAADFTREGIASLHAQIAAPDGHVALSSAETPAANAARTRIKLCLGQRASADFAGWADAYFSAEIWHRVLAAYLQEQGANLADVEAIAKLPEFRSYPLWANKREDDLIRQLSLHPEIKLVGNELEAAVFYLIVSRLSAIIRSLGVQPAQPATQIGGTIRSGDYPSSALDHNIGGRTQVAVFIAPDGSVTDCTLLTSSGSDQLDEAACRIIAARFRYTPARDSAGRAVPDVKIVGQTWIPEP